MVKKICFITASRSEYGLLLPLIQAIAELSDFEVQLVVTGMHLSNEFGLTVNEIHNDGLAIDYKIETLLSSDTPSAVIKSMGLTLIGLAEPFEKLKPDLVIILGDRFEIFCVAAAALVYRIPIAHLHGGEITAGAYDDSFRHSVTKMSNLHFVAAEEYKNRVIQLGERPETVFNVGAIGLDNIKKIRLFTKEELAKALEIIIDRKYFLLTYHPVTAGNSNDLEVVDKIVSSLLEYDDHMIIATMANADNGGRLINDRLRKWQNLHPDKVHLFTSLGQKKYLSLLANASLIIGNSSSGIIEAPEFHIPTINIGDRQEGRLCSESVINCSYDRGSIDDALQKSLNDDFRRSIQNQKLLYGDGKATIKIVEILNFLAFPIPQKHGFYTIAI